jgi:hypothetical protein
MTGLFRIPPPQLQIDFAFSLEQIREQYLQEALSRAVVHVNISDIDTELTQFVPAESLTKLAGHGLRGELMFAVPSLLRAEPRLLGYYRLLLGYSQKVFYGITGIGRFKSMEESGSLTRAQESALGPLCLSLSAAAVLLLDGIGAKRISRELLDDLALLTVGPQLRGGYNVRAGIAGIVKVFDAISDIVSHTIVNTAPQLIEIRNAAGRRVLIRFASDPDIRIQEEMTAVSLRNIVAIEVKAGLDFSNIHNRIGEAEKVIKRRRPTAMSSAGPWSTLTGLMSPWLIRKVRRLIDFIDCHKSMVGLGKNIETSSIASSR